MHVSLAWLPVLRSQRTEILVASDRVGLEGFPVSLALRKCWILQGPSFLYAETGTQLPHSALFSMLRDFSFPCLTDPFPPSSYHPPIQGFFLCVCVKLSRLERVETCLLCKLCYVIIFYNFISVM